MRSVGDLPNALETTHHTASVRREGVRAEVSIVLEGHGGMGRQLRHVHVSQRTEAADDEHREGGMNLSHELLEGMSLGRWLWGCECKEVRQGGTGLLAMSSPTESRRERPLSYSTHQFGIHPPQA